MWLALAAGESGAGRAQQGGGPKLIVMVVVDQMRADYLTFYNERYKSGLRVLLDQGAVFEEAEYPYHNTVTCAGHATIGTGALPRTHGMVLNGWWHRDERRTFECTDDPSTPDITYGRPVKVGNSAKRLLVPTLADELRTQKPGSRVVALSLKARGAINLAGHAGAVTWFDDAAGSFATSKAFAQRPIEQIRAFVARDPFEKDEGRVWTLRDSPSTYVRRDAGVGERPPTPWGGLFPHRIAGRASLDGLFFNVWQVSPFADAYLERMAAAMIDGFSLGQRDATDYLGVAFSSLDEVGHDFGPESRETEDMLRHLDATLGSFIEKLDKNVGRENYVLGMSADHGVAAIAKPGTGGRVAPEDVRDRIEETLIEQFGPLQKGTYVDAVNYQYVYFAPGVFDRLRASGDAMRKVEAAILDVPGVARVLRADRLSDTSTDRIVRAAALSYVPDRSGDLIVVAKENWIINLRNASAATTHGSPYSYDTHVPVILLGHGIKPGRMKGQITPADIAPTLARIAGVRLPKAEGRVLHDALK